MSFKTPTFIGSVIMALALAVPLSGCQSTQTSLPPTAAPGFWQNMQGRVQAIKDITLTGRVLINHQRERFASNFYYQGYDAEHYELRLASSLGKEIARIKVAPGKATLFSSGHLYEATSASELAAKHLGMPLPLDDFHKLILGIAPNDKSLFNDFGILLQSQVDNLVINYNDYTSVQNVALPSEIQVLGPDLELKITTRDIRDIEFNYPKKD